MSISFPYQPGLIKCIFSAQPSIVISEGFFQWTPAALWAKLRLKIPMVISYERTMHTERNAGRLRTYFRRLMVRQTDAICCNGKLSREYCTSVLGMSSQNIVTGTMAADTDELALYCSKMPEEKIHSLEKSLGLVHPVFLYVGRLVRSKGLQELLKGWEIYMNDLSSSESTLLLVGDGPERDVLENIVREKKMPRVLFTGRVDYDKIYRYYAVSDVFVIPTLEDNWSLVVPEAMACCKPVLTSRYNGCWPELVHQGKNGWVFDPFNPFEIANFLKASKERMSLLPEMGRISHTIVQKYTPQNAAESILNTCFKAIENRKNREKRTKEHFI